MRMNPRNVTFDELLSVLEDYGFVIRQGKGSHYFVDVVIRDRVWTETIVKPHGGRRYVHPKTVKRVLKHIDEMDKWGE